MSKHPDYPRLRIVPLSLAKANAFVSQHHRHHGPLRFHKFAIGVEDEVGALHGIAIIGRPVARMRDDGRTAEVARLATDGAPNACSKLLSACARICREMGYERVGTYILESEPGTSLRAAGWKFAYVSPGGSWSRHDRPGRDNHPLGPKQLYEAPPRAGGQEAA